MIQDERISFRVADHVLRAAEQLTMERGLAKLSVLARSALIQLLINEGRLAPDGGPLPEDKPKYLTQIPAMGKLTGEALNQSKAQTRMASGA